MAIKFAAAFLILNSIGYSEKVMSAGKWYAALQKLGDKYHRGKTTVERRRNRAAFLDAIERALDGRTITWSGTIRDVVWKDGIAEVAAYSSKAIAEIANAKTDTVTVGGPSQFKLLATQEEALQIRPGMLLKFKAKLVFYRQGSNPITGSVGEQRLFSFTHKKLGIAGVTWSTDYQVKIQNKTFKGLWAEEVEE